MAWAVKIRVVVGLLLAMAASLAQAVQWRGYEVQRFASPQRQPPHDFRREAPQRFQRSDRRGEDDAARPQRLSPEERRQLRRDVHDAGRELYRRRR